MKLRITLATLVVAIGVTGCAKEPAPTQIPTLSATDQSANVEPIIQLVEQHCFDRADDTARFDAGLKATGWNFVSTQRADPANPLSLDAWKTAGVQILRGEVVSDAVYTCHVSISADYAPSIAAMADGFSEVADGRIRNRDQWRWKRSSTRELQMDIVEGADAESRLQINVETYRLPWWKGLLG